jgi:peptidoglycan hydrolase-like protein with peptidoglycan-binding domain
MAAYRMGSKGDETARIQERLKQKGLYRGPVDGDFGGGTEAAIKAFQKSKGLKVDGVVGPLTWKALFAEPIAEPSLKRNFRRSR